MVAKAKQKILCSAQALMLKHGYHGTGTNAIIADAGVSKGSFFYHFPDKPSLIKAALKQHFHEHFTLPFANAMQRHQHPRGVLIDFIDQLEYECNQKRFEGGCLLGNIALELTDTQHEVQRLVQDMFDQWRALLADLIQDYPMIIQHDQFITLYIAAIEGIIMTTRVHKDPQRTSAEFAACRTLVNIAFVDK